jgi:peptidoglycan/LPS O-acetylase OafA/YrhL
MSGEPSNTSGLERRAAVSNGDNPGGFSHVPSLDGVRGLAIFLVVFNHIVPLSDHSGIRLVDILAQLRDCSWIGVYLFFALSGFLITGILVDTLEARHYFRVFYVRRALRIFPPYYGFIIVLLLLTKTLHFHWGGWQYFYLTYSANLAVWRSDPLFLSHFRIEHFWSLQVEEQFYFVWPLIVYRFRSRARLILICLMMCFFALILRVSLVSAHASSIGTNFLPYSLTLCCCDNLLYGCILALLIRTSWRKKMQRWAPFTFAACTVLVIMERIIHRGTPWTNGFFMPTLGFSLIGIGSASLIAMSLHPSTCAHRLFRLSIFRFLGRYSYGLYIFHYSVYGFLAAPLHNLFVQHLHSRVLGTLLSVGVVAVVSLLLALVSYHLYEIHFLRLKKYFSYCEHTDELRTAKNEAAVSA